MEPRAENWARAQFHYLLNGKPAGVPCPHLDGDLRCRLFGQPERPAVCASLPPSAEMCGADRVHALQFLATLEHATQPGV